MALAVDEEAAEEVEADVDEDAEADFALATILAFVWLNCTRKSKWQFDLLMTVSCLGFECVSVSMRS